MEWMLLPLKRYAQFSGRSRRKEYWMFFLFTVIVNLVLGVVDELLGLKSGGSNGDYTDNGLLGGVFALATFVPSLAVAVRRLHDTDRSGWWLLLPVGVVILALFGIGASGTTTDGGMGTILAAIAIMVISVVVLIVFLCLDGTDGPNRFGDDPKGVAYEGVFD